MVQLWSALTRDELYWILHAPRQTGKSTFLQSWMQEINAETEAVACYADWTIRGGSLLLKLAFLDKFYTKENYNVEDKNALRIFFCRTVCSSFLLFPSASFCRNQQ
ncbi:MAG: hypothetical protein D3924_11250 [Candidatus Electrothrix sp. AR4]|nr:hypothetical protein [Candidatus Electrothrix sp. AR4]